MAGGPIAPHSRFPATAGAVFAYVYVSAGANSKHEEGLGVAASIAADATWRLRFQLPPAIPTGTFKLLLRAQANATSGSAKVNPKYAFVAAGADPGGATLNAQGTQTVTWAAGDNDKYKDAKITLNAITAPTTGDENKAVVLDLVFETASWTLAHVSSWHAFLIW
jgi:hypothetical protein